MITILETTPKNPITLMGSRAGICWNANTSDNERNYKRGLDCIKSDHGRLLEFIPVDIVIEGYSARVMREYMRHVGGGLSLLQESTRYVNCKDFRYTTPDSVSKNSEALFIYNNIMNNIAKSYEELESIGIPKEDIANILPLGMHTKVVDHKNLRNLTDMSKKRLCMRAYHEYRKLMHEIMETLKNYSEEWEIVIDLLFKPQCDVLGYCPELKSCGRKTCRK